MKPRQPVTKAFVTAGAKSSLEAARVRELQEKMRRAQML
jgi:hypothetical protein